MADVLAISEDRTLTADELALVLTYLAPRGATEARLYGYGTVMMRPQTEKLPPAVPPVPVRCTEQSKGEMRGSW